MTNDVRSDMPDAFERALAARLAAHAAVASGKPSAEAVSRAVAAGPGAVRAGALRRGALPRSRLFALAGVALVSASFLAGLIAGRFLERDDHQPAPSATMFPTLGEPGPLVFSAAAPGDLYLWNAVTQQFQRVAGNESTQLSPDGRWAAYLDACSQCFFRIGETGLDVPVRSGRVAFERKPIPGGNFGFGPRSWSPDSRFFAREAAGSLDIIDVVGAAPPQNPGSPFGLLSIKVPEAGSASALAWSPDGATIGLITQTGDIAVVDVASGTLRMLTRSGSFLTPEEEVGPPLFWSPDGATLLSSDGARAITVDVATGKATLAAGAQAQAVLGWSPDGRVVIDTEGTSDADVLRVGDPPGSCTSAPVWSPQNRGAGVSVGDLFVDVGEPSVRAVARDLCREGMSATVTWSPTGTWLAVTVIDVGAVAPAHFGTVYLVPADGGQPVVYAETDLVGPLTVRWPPTQF